MKNEIKNKKINLYIGLTTNKNKNLKVKEVLKIISFEFINEGINGFSVYRIKGFWDGKEESSLLISFINNFKIDYKTLIKIVIKLKKDLGQDAILLEVLSIPFEFI